ncbi:LADA_0A08790g1_1 [Lachancea dasiensis]|uniref:DNA damage checkpoint control protein RAD17 n=1 Tax=Lachancea dasiensis TaxID=1072105 RepID=A0A1G4IQB4_9SACH|nr:LADA_0A08790g1_1 [Lachancea dasiensis]
MLDQSPLFSASTVHLEHITTALNCLRPFGTKDDVLIIIDKDGLSFARENNRVISIQLYLSKELFICYRYNAQDDNPDAHTKVCLKINHILDSVSVVSRDKDDIVECTLSYDGEGSPFVLIFEDSVITEKVEYSTYLVKEWDATGLELDTNAVTSECIMKGDVLYGALQDLKEIGCKECYTYAKSSKSGKRVFALISRSQLGLSKIMLPGERSILEKLEVYDATSHEQVYDVPVLGYFDFSTLDKIRPSAKTASKVMLRKDAHGLLSINMLSQTDDVILTDARRSRSTNWERASSSNDYPGIVIDISIVEKVRIDEADDDSEARFLMESSEDSVKPAYYPTSVPSRPPVLTATSHTEESLLFGRQQRSTEPDAGGDEDYIPATNDIPLFF